MMGNRMLGLKASLRSACAAAALIVAAAASAQQGHVLYEVQSPYQRITVFDTADGMRQLIFDAKFDGTDAIQSQMNLARPTELTLSYARHMIAALPLVDEPRRVLIVGLGGGCLQRYLYALLPKVTIQSAELDPDVLDVARRFFQFKEDERQRVAIGDGRKFIEQTRDRYDLIMLDAFSADSIPFALTTREFLTAVRDRLTTGGLVAANLWSTAPEYYDMLRTYEDVFPEWRLLNCRDYGNVIFVAFPRPRGLTPEQWIERARAFEQKHPTGLDLPTLIDRSLVRNFTIPGGARVLRDAPVRSTPAALPTAGGR